ncbi:MAG: hypothetical protein JNM64_07430 [Chloroflexia bacterium]|nr:hypothetical protein [Chloroflexia bacterium]
MPDVSQTWPWISLAVLGAFHGLNPAMGWLFAVALGLQERRWRAVLAALGLIALGHALAIALVAIPVGFLGLRVPSSLLLAVSGLVLLGFAAYKVALRFRHPRWVGMRVSGQELVLWSFLMASAHGAGLMLAPLIATLSHRQQSTGALAADHAGHLGHAIAPVPAELGAALAPALIATALHTAAMLAVMGAAGLLVYQVLGVELLRRAWINLDFIWAGALMVTGGLALGLGVVASVAS